MPRQGTTQSHRSCSGTCLNVVFLKSSVYACCARFWRLSILGSHRLAPYVSILLGPHVFPIAVFSRVQPRSFSFSSALLAKDYPCARGKLLALENLAGAVRSIPLCRHRDTCVPLLHLWRQSCEDVWRRFLWALLWLLLRRNPFPSHCNG